jgi:hypothetical protein
LAREVEEIEVVVLGGSQAAKMRGRDLNRMRTASMLAAGSV